MDEALALPTERAARIALRTQQVIGFETNVANVADPLGGSYFVEALTDEVEREAEEIFAHLDELGAGSMLEGVIRGIEENWFQGRIADSAYDLERRLNQGRRVVVGVNRFTEGNDEDPIPTLQITHEDEARQIKRLNTVRQHRDQGSVDAALARLAADAADPEVNLMPGLIDAVTTYATLGEVMATLAGVFGRHTEVPTI
jgi:methylmalonyl-CoA mutase N-terminal domain/subunit